MAFHYSLPFESLVEAAKETEGGLRHLTARVLIVGSGYGGAVAAYRLAEIAPVAERDRSVLVLERGREYAPGEFPADFAALPGHLRVRRPDSASISGNEEALFDLHIGANVDVLVGSGLGGTSLINANVALQPEADVFQQAPWPEAIRRESAGNHSQAAPLGRAFAEVRRWLGVVGADQRRRWDRKQAAFARFAHAMNFKPEVAPVAVNFVPGQVNPSGVGQAPCTGCGNCVTGCNIGAKNTLAMNLIPAAHARGVEFFTGATVLDVRPLAGGAGGPRWSVRARSTSRDARNRDAGDLEIRADFVILAAGTLGSTEILQRSAAVRALRVSPCLGERFSTNGDALAMSFAGRERVDASGAADDSLASDCGPTITDLARGRLAGQGPASRFTLENGVVPFAIRELVGELVTTAAQFGRLGDNALPGWLADHPRNDPLAVHREAFDRSQLFLVMSHDGSAGRLRFDTSAGHDDGRLVPTWPDPPSTPAADAPPSVLEQIDAKLREHDRSAGLDHAQYVPNPAWRLLPEQARGVMSGRFPGGRLVTVHPLGGCAMADDGRQGVVDDVGAVYSGFGAEVHAGLHVLDGAIVPTSLGVNPFLTIAALAWRACDAILDSAGRNSPGSVQVLQPVLRRRPAPIASVDTSPIVIRERLMGRLFGARSSAAEARLRAIDPSFARWFERDGLILDLETIPGPGPHAGYLAALLRGDGAVPIRATLYRNHLEVVEIEEARMHGMPPEHAGQRTEIASGTGTIRILVPDRPNNVVTRTSRTLLAILAYLRRRESPLGFGARLLRGAGRSAVGKGALDKLRAWLEVAAMHATYRDFDYHIRLDEPPQGGVPRSLTLTGRKRIAWRTDHERLWQSLLRLPAALDVRGVATPFRASFNVDTRYMVDEGRPSLYDDAASSVPHGLLNIVAFLGRFARGILQAGFWEFAAPDYPDSAHAVEPAPFLPSSVDGAPLETWELRTQRRSDASETVVPLRLSRYAQPGPGGRKVALLLHGLAQGSLVFAHPAQQIDGRATNLATWLHQRGYDVWLADYRLSNQFDRTQVPYDGWTIDEIARFDVPAAVEHILAQYPAGTRLHIFAHCVGAVATAMAILAGKVTNAQIASVALNAIHPWIVPSPANDFRARLVTFVRDYLNDDFFDPRIPTADRVGAAQSLLDRLAYSMARLGETDPASNRPVDPTDPDRPDQGHRHGTDRNLANAICDRMTFLYGRMWRHENSQGVHAHWKDLVGPAPGAVQRHLFYLLTRERLLNHDGENVYLTDSNLPRWAGIRTLFLHGDRSDVFNPQSASRAATRLQLALQHHNVLDTPVRLKRIQGYGHMDVILADRACSVSFPYLHAFFQGRFDTELEHDGLQLDEPRSHHDHGRRPLVGPVLRGALMDRDQLVLRAWVELPTLLTTSLGTIRVRAPAGAMLAHLNNEAGGFDAQYAWADVTLDPAEYVPLEIDAPVSGSGVSNFSITSAVSPATSAPAPCRPTWLARLLARQSSTTAGDCHFLVGSCRYPGTPFDRAQADAVFEEMLAIVQGDAPCDALFLVGDQVYADASAGLLDPRAWRDRYTDRYREAFGAPHMRELLRSIPVHFAVDDHEFADNFDGVAQSGPGLPSSVPPHWRDLETWFARVRSGVIVDEEFRFARKTAGSYMSSGRELHPFGGSAASPDTFWYALEHGNEFPLPAFVLDTRSERQLAGAAQSARLMRPEQQTALFRWLDDVNAGRWSDCPKFIFMGSVLVPLHRDCATRGAERRDDGWAGYPAELEALVHHIVDHRIQRVVFVSGDPHLSCAFPLELVGDAGRRVKALQIVASGLYAPLPFANLSRHDVDWYARHSLRAGRYAVDYKPHFLCDARSHFVRVSAEPKGGQWHIAVVAHGRSGPSPPPLSFTL